MKWSLGGGLLAASLSFSLLLGCTTPPSPAGPGQAPTTGGQAAEQPQAPAATIQAQPTASPAPAERAGAPAPAPVEPQGKVVYAWHTDIAPAWFDPQENPQVINNYGFQYALFDAVAKHLPGQPFAPSLAESYEIAPDFKSATFQLRPNLTFHNGDPVTSEDVKFTFEKYRGANATLLHDKTERVDTPDPRTITFTFREPFLDFQILYASPASGAAWVVPKKYYEQVGPDAFKQQPVGAGPYKFVRFSGGELEMEAFAGYWRKMPAVQTLVIKAIPEDATRVAALQNGEVDLANLVPGTLVETVQADPKLQLAPILGASRWLEFPGYDQPASPFHNLKVRQAVSLALDRRAMSEAEEAGLSGYEGNWIPADWPGAIERPMPEYEPAKARQLLAEAGVPNGFEAGQLTPTPPYFSLGERVITQLREVGIRLRLNQMERGAYLRAITEGPTAFPAGMVLPFAAAPGDAASRIRSYAMCGGNSSRTCDPQIDDRMKRYDASVNPQERQQLLREVQEYILDNAIFVPLHRLAFICAVGPRIANPWETIYGAIPQYGYVGPYEDLRLKE